MMSQKTDSGFLTRIAQIEGNVVTITLSRPEFANALNAETLSLVLESIDAAESEPDARAIVLRGMGKHFCAGADLRELSENGSKSVRKLLNLFREATQRFERSHLLVIGAVQGAARAGGLELLLACDAVVASTDATLGDAHLANGLLPGGGSTARLHRVIGRARARWMILSAAAIDAQQALDWGICLEVVSPESLDTRAVELARSMSVGHPDAVLRAKRLLALTDEVSLTSMLEMEIATLEGFASSSVFRDGVGTFLNRKRPVPASE
ncbi:hypothetical protein A8B84_18595 [Marinobacter sp. EhC06]|jgi:enoyl-CoA hydratase/carnithine racemase|nr:hypothetical protein A8B84_18595 [Marinobacter sp. EhC06]OAN96006.1 hypothetical protein A8B80_00045 [Marinobacter sp. EhN04]